MLKKLCLFIVLFLTLSVSASTLKKTDHDIYYVWQGGGKPYMSERYMTFEMDGIIAYCIEPGVGVKSYDYKEMNELPFAKETLEKIKLYAYYGYTYKNHNTLKYRMATQALIWEEISKQTTSFYTKQYGYGEYINIDEERKNINELVNKHYLKPSFQNIKIKEFKGTKVELIDENNVLSEFEVIKGNAKINNNKLLLEVKENEIITLKRKKYDNKVSIFYEGKDTKTQAMAILTLDDLDEININVEKIEGKIKIIKKPNKESKYNIDGALYGIYNLENELMKKIEIKKGVASTNIDNGKYYIKEIKAPLGYTIDENKYYFEINKENIEKEIEVIDDVIESEIIIHKVYGNEKINEENVIFEIYENDNLLKTVTTNKEGYIKILLPFGTYKFKQITTKEGYIKVDDFIVNIDGSKKEILYELVDEEINAYIKLIKIDSVTNEIINKKIKFKIKNIDTNKYICENKECVFETNNGYFITKNKYRGNLLIEEVKEKIDGFIWNNEKVKIYIGDKLLENDTYIITYKNERVKGKIEVLKINENNEKLNNVTIGLYAKEDIYLNNKIIYKKDELIERKNTIDGKIEFTNLELGQYYIKELKTDDKYILDDKIYDVTLKYQDEDTKEVYEVITIKNYLKKGKLIFNKIDSVTKLGIENTIICIYKDKELIYEIKTDQNGQILLDLEIGQYYIVEKEASLGYNKSDEKIEFDIEYNKETNLYMENDFIIEVPDTLKNNYNYIFIIIIILGLIKKHEKNINNINMYN